MSFQIKSDYFFLWYLLKFIAAFCILYIGTLAIIGLSAPGGYYSDFVKNYLDYISLLRKSLLYGSKFVLRIIGLKATIINAYYIKVQHGWGVHLVYSCLGYGILSMWGAFIFANKGNFSKKIKWLMGGGIIIWVINVLRISLLLFFGNSQWRFFFNLNHHTVFNIVSYSLILIMIYFFNRSEKGKSDTAN